MPSRSARCFWITCASLGLALLASAPSALATITITLDRKGGLDAEGDAAYFAAYNTDLAGYTRPWSGSTSGLFLDTADGFQDFDLGASDSDASPDSTQAITFTVSSDKASFSAGQAIVVVSGTLTNSGGTFRAPIAFVNGARCVDNPTGCHYRRSVSTVGDRYFAAKFAAGASVTLGIFPKDICRYVELLSSPNKPIGCTESSLISGLAGGSTTVGSLDLRVEVFAVAADIATGPADSATAEDSQALDLTFTNVGPSFSCADTTNLYYPSDNAIIVDTGRFYVAGTTGGAPGAEVIAVVRRDDALGSADVSSSYSVGQTVTRNSIGGEHLIGGFENSTSTENKYFTVGFMGRDAAGLVQSVVTAPLCELKGVQTADVQGFLETGKCFVATAAFRSPRAAPVELLREFRDAVLLRFPAGRAFVDWYYGWSPRAAIWLERNPAFRLPVLALLLPAQALAWLALRPALLAALALAGAALLIAAFQARRAAR